MTATFELRHDKDGDVICCDQCSSEAQTTRYEDKYLCPYCYGTHLGNVLQYSNQYSRETVKLALGLTAALNILEARILNQLGVKA